MREKKGIDLFFYINLFCNDRCDFCFFRKLPPRDNFLKLNDVKKVLMQFAENDIRGIVLTGGEPTLNPHFRKIIEYIWRAYVKNKKVSGFDLSTNAITSADSDFARMIEKYFRPFDRRYQDIKISFSFSSLGDRQRKKIINTKIEGIKNLMGADSNIEAVVTITRDNFRHIFKMIKMLVDLYNNKRKMSKYYFKFDFRLPYFSMMYDLADLHALVVPPKMLLRELNRALDFVRQYDIPATLHNIPLCYIKKRPEYFHAKNPPQGIAVFPDTKEGFVCREKKFSFHKDRSCRACRFNVRCGGIEKIYLDEFGYKLFPIQMGAAPDGEREEVL